MTRYLSHVISSIRFTQCPLCAVTTYTLPLSAELRADSRPVNAKHALCIFMWNNCVRCMRISAMLPLSWWRLILCVLSSAFLFVLKLLACTNTTIVSFVHLFRCSSFGFFSCVFSAGTIVERCNRSKLGSAHEFSPPGSVAFCFFFRQCGKVSFQLTRAQT